MSTNATEVLDDSQVQARADMRAYLETMIQKIVRNPAGVRVEFFRGDKTTVYVVVVAPEDLGLLLGKKGATIEAIRVILKAQMARFGMRAVVQLDQQLEAYCARGSAQD
ncbi:KH domain-containing protein [Bdellovibrio sp. NC01]|uniref:KH domain-containing protein n=1 Tax=Bdellovibrio sp. NC01 TaxID=2220073 RepID=UPI001159682F|nr:KH domain-containing protein [Bdellovibrio sp. NC01]QDK39413.1 hypothetical protein DOE51_18335 [Bdellovibrio sp. NC01]